MKRFVLVFALAVGLLTSASTLQAQVNMSRYITLTVTNGAAIKLDFRAASAGTPVRIVSGSNTRNITVGTGWYNNNVPSTFTVTATASTMKIYGDITSFDCQQNGANLTALDLSHNTQLTGVNCFNNNLSILDVSHNTLFEWLVCSNNQLSNLDVSHNTQLKMLWCCENKLNSLDVSGCTQLTKLRCSSNTLSSLNVSGCTQLTKLECFKNTLTSLDVSGCTQLTKLECFNNTLTSLDVSGCTQLTELYCSNNTLNSLDVSGCTQLTRLFCNNNNLSNLDISHNTQLTGLFCHGNNFSTAALDDIYCTLPDRTGNTNGKIMPVKNSSDPNHATVLATNAQNAIDKNWNVLYDDGGADIPTTGSYDCSTAVAEAAAEPALTLYPNPVADVLYLSATARTVRIYNIYGIEVAHATDTDRVEVSHLPAGVYTVNADGTVAKMVKR